MPDRVLIVSIALGGVGWIAAGAFGAHAMAADARAIGLIETAGRFLGPHLAAALAVTLSPLGGRPLGKAASYALTLGAVVFAFALIALAFGAPRLFGAVAPVGGITMMAGWALLGAAAWR